MRVPRMRFPVDCRPGGILAAIMTAASVACHHAAPTPAATPVSAVANQDSIARANARRDSVARAEAARRLAAAREDSIRAAAAARTAALASARALLLQSIHFDFDHAEILASDRSVLDRKAGVLNANRSIHLRIEGSTDERGSDEYNLALGMRRAAVAKQYLVERGVESSTIATVSYGEERPVCQDHDESCWSRNRRAEFTIISGGDIVVVPDR